MVFCILSVNLVYPSWVPHTDVAFASGMAAHTRIQARELASHPACKQVPTWPCSFCTLCFHFDLIQKPSLLSGKSCPIMNLYFLSHISLSACYLFFQNQKAKFTFNTSLHGNKFFSDLIVPKNFLFLHGFSLTPCYPFLIWAMQVDQNEICHKSSGYPCHCLRNELIL